MSDNKCNVCQNNLILDEENICAQCELNDDDHNGGITGVTSVNCGACKVIVEEDSEGLVCDMCNNWYHNSCCENPLIEDLYSLLNEAPNNVKWFCDECIWETEKWIKGFKVNKIKGVVCDEEPEYDPTYHPEYPEIKIEIQEEGVSLGSNDSQFTDSDDDEINKIEKNNSVRKKAYQCNQCGKAFSSQSSLKRHINNYQCNHCEECFANKSVLKKHLQTHTENIIDIQNEGIPIDSDVSQSINSKNGGERKKKKKRKRTGEKPYQCSHCVKAFPRQDNLVKHERTHTGEKSYQCGQCGKVFSRSDHLKTHEKIHSGERPHQCGHCGKLFSRRENLKVHERIHTREKLHHCNLCEECFSNKGDLKKHLKMHPGDKPYQCSHCTKAFHRQDHLNKHEKTHTGEKPYQCGICGKCFGRRDHLDKHERVHTVDKPHQCSHCGKAFARRDNFKAHLRIHTGEKPYQCNQCKKDFTTRSALKEHLETHSGNKPFQCMLPSPSLSTFTKPNSILPMSTTSMSDLSTISLPSHTPPLPSLNPFTIPMSVTSLQSRPTIVSSSSKPLTSSHNIPICLSTQSQSYTPRPILPLHNSPISFPHMP